jgi:hypothetical protein
LGLSDVRTIHRGHVGTWPFGSDRRYVGLLGRRCSRQAVVHARAVELSATTVGGHAARSECHVPPALRSLARKEESIVVGDAVVVRALVFDRQRLAIEVSVFTSENPVEQPQSAIHPPSGGQLQ